MSQALGLAAFALGMVLLAAGCWMAWPPFGVMAAGAGLLAVSVGYTRGGDA